VVGEARAYARGILVREVLAEIATNHKFAVELPELGFQARDLCWSYVLRSECESAQGLRRSSAAATDIGKDLTTKREGESLAEGVGRISRDPSPDGITAIAGGMFFVGIKSIDPGRIAGLPAKACELWTKL
jgi:hypothetical protein